MMRIPLKLKHALASTALLAMAAATQAQPGPGNPPASAMPPAPPMDSPQMNCPMMGMGPGMMGHSHGHGMMLGGDMSHMLYGLNLTEEQQDKVFNILHRQEPRKRESLKLLHKSIAALHDLVRSSNYSDANVQSFSRAVGQAGADLALMHTQTERQIYEILTPEQRRQFDERGHGPRHRPGCAMPGTMPMPRR